MAENERRTARLVRGYTGGIIASGTAVLVVAATRSGFGDLLGPRPWGFVMLAVLLVCMFAALNALNNL